MIIHIIQHVSFEGPGAIAQWANETGHTIAITSVFTGADLPALDSFDMLVVMGGPMGAYDESRHAWLVEEKRFLAHAIQAEKTILGLCLGAQLLAGALGGRITRNIVKEIGWYPVSLTPLGWNSPLFGRLPATFQAFHWHGDTFEIPGGALHMASSEACPNQAFLYGDRVVGLQFHLESTPEGVEDLVKNCAQDLAEESDYVQKADRILGEPEAYGSLKKNLSVLLDALAENITTPH
jgi:GMP synthase-like glutamine amidotransferase